MREPLVLCEGGDIEFFRTAKDAAAGLEPWYVREESFQLYDSDGCVLRVTTDGKQVTISDPSTPESREYELRFRLRDLFLASRYHPRAQIANASLDQLIALGLSGRRRGAG